MSQPDLYKILDVPADADLAAIKSQFRKLAYELHPDRNGGDKVKEEKFKDVQMAYAVLSDKDKRRAYDEIRRRNPASKHPLFGPEFDELVERIREEGIRGEGLDDMIMQFLGVCQTTYERAKEQAAQPGDKGSMLESLAGLFGVDLTQTARTIRSGTIKQENRNRKG